MSYNYGFRGRQRTFSNNRFPYHKTNVHNETYFRTDQTYFRRPYRGKYFPRGREYDRFDDTRHNSYRYNNNYYKWDDGFNQRQRYYQGTNNFVEYSNENEKEDYYKDRYNFDNGYKNGEDYYHTETGEEYAELDSYNDHSCHVSDTYKHEYSDVQENENQNKASNAKSEINESVTTIEKENKEAKTTDKKYDEKIRNDSSEHKETEIKDDFSFTRTRPRKYRKKFYYHSLSSKQFVKPFRKRVELDHERLKKKEKNPDIAVVSSKSKKSSRSKKDDSKNNFPKSCSKKKKSPRTNKSLRGSGANVPLAIKQLSTEPVVHIERLSDQIMYNQNNNYRPNISTEERRQNEQYQRSSYNNSMRNCYHQPSQYTRNYNHYSNQPPRKHYWQERQQDFSYKYNSTKFRSRGNKPECLSSAKDCDAVKFGNATSNTSVASTTVCDKELENTVTGSIETNNNAPNVSAESSKAKDTVNTFMGDEVPKNSVTDKEPAISSDGSNLSKKSSLVIVDEKNTLSNTAEIGNKFSSTLELQNMLENEGSEPMDLDTDSNSNISIGDINPNLSYFDYTSDKRLPKEIPTWSSTPNDVTTSTKITKDRNIPQTLTTINTTVKTLTNAMNSPVQTINCLNDPRKKIEISSQALSTPVKKRKKYNYVVDQDYNPEQDCSDSSQTDTELLKKDKPTIKRKKSESRETVTKNAQNPSKIQRRRKTSAAEPTCFQIEGNSNNFKNYRIPLKNNERLRSRSKSVAEKRDEENDEHVEHDCSNTVIKDSCAEFRLTRSLSQEFGVTNFMSLPQHHSERAPYGSKSRSRSKTPDSRSRSKTPDSRSRSKTPDFKQSVASKKDLCGKKSRSGSKTPDLDQPLANEKDFYGRKSRPRSKTPDSRSRTPDLKQAVLPLKSAVSSTTNDKNDIPVMEKDSNLQNTVELFSSEAVLPLQSPVHSTTSDKNHIPKTIPLFPQVDTLTDPRTNKASSPVTLKYFQKYGLSKSKERQEPKFETLYKPIGSVNDYTKVDYEPTTRSVNGSTERASCQMSSKTTNWKKRNVSSRQTAKKQLAPSGCVAKNKPLFESNISKQLGSVTKKPEKQTHKINLEKKDLNNRKTEKSKTSKIVPWDHALRPGQSFSEKTWQPANPKIVKAGIDVQNRSTSNGSSTVASQEKNTMTLNYVSDKKTLALKYPHIEPLQQFESAIPKRPFKYTNCLARECVYKSDANHVASSTEANVQNPSECIIQTIKKDQTESDMDVAYTSEDLIDLTADDEMDDSHDIQYIDSLVVELFHDKTVGSTLPNKIVSPVSNQEATVIVSTHPEKAAVYDKQKTSEPHETLDQTVLSIQSNVNSSGTNRSITTSKNPTPINLTKESVAPSEPIIYKNLEKTLIPQEICIPLQGQSVAKVSIPFTVPTTNQESVNVSIAQLQPPSLSMPNLIESLVKHHLDLNTPNSTQNQVTDTRTIQPRQVIQGVNQNETVLNQHNGTVNEPNQNTTVTNNNASNATIPNKSCRVIGNAEPNLLNTNAPTQTKVVTTRGTADIPVQSSINTENRNAIQPSNYRNAQAPRPTHGENARRYNIQSGGVTHTTQAASQQQNNPVLVPVTITDFINVLSVFVIIVSDISSDRTLVQQNKLRRLQKYKIDQTFIEREMQFLNIEISQRYRSLSEEFLSYLKKIRVVNFTNIRNLVEGVTERLDIYHEIDKINTIVVVERLYTLMKDLKPQYNSHFLSYLHAEITKLHEMIQNRFRAQLQIQSAQTAANAQNVQRQTHSSTSVAPQIRNAMTSTQAPIRKPPPAYQTAAQHVNHNRQPLGSQQHEAVNLRNLLATSPCANPKAPVPHGNNTVSAKNHPTGNSNQFTQDQLKQLYNQMQMYCNLHLVGKALNSQANPQSVAHNKNSNSATPHSEFIRQMQKRKEHLSAQKQMTTVPQNQNLCEAANVSQQLRNQTENQQLPLQQMQHLTQQVTRGQPQINSLQNVSQTRRPSQELPLLRRPSQNENAQPTQQIQILPNPQNETVHQNSAAIQLYQLAQNSRPLSNEGQQNPNSYTIHYLPTPQNSTLCNPQEQIVTHNSDLSSQTPSNTNQINLSPTDTNSSPTENFVIRLPLSQPIAETSPIINMKIKREDLSNTDTPVLNLQQSEIGPVAVQDRQDSQPEELSNETNFNGYHEQDYSTAVKEETQTDDFVDVEEWFSKQIIDADTYECKSDSDPEPLVLKQEVQEESDDQLPQPVCVVEHPECFWNERLCLCGKKAELICTCTIAMYCSETCQHKDWKKHQTACMNSQRQLQTLKTF